MKKEFTVKPYSGYLALSVAILSICGAIAGFALESIWVGVVLTLLFIVAVTGFKVVNPNSSTLMVLCGDKDATPVLNAGTLHN